MIAPGELDRWDFIRPSCMAALDHCPGSANQQAKVCNEDFALYVAGDPAAEVGNAGHVVSQIAVATMYGDPSNERSQEDVLADLDSRMKSLDGWTRGSILRCIAYVCNLIDGLRKEGYQVTVETEYELPGKGIGIKRKGTADVVLFVRRGKYLRIVLVDYKLGFLNQGHAHENLQLAAYACMAWDRFDPDRVDVHLAQGRMKDFTSARYDHEAISRVRPRLKYIAKAADDDDALLSPSIKACRYCKALPKCTVASARFKKSSDEAALFGFDNADMVRMDEDRKLANRFAASVKQYQDQCREAEKARTAFSPANGRD